MKGFNRNTKNSQNNINDGVAILVKKSLRHKIDDDFVTDTLEIIIDTTLGTIFIAAIYLPPRRLPTFPRLSLASMQ